MIEKYFHKLAHVDIPDKLYFDFRDDYFDALEEFIEGNFLDVKIFKIFGVLQDNIEQTDDINNFVRITLSDQNNVSFTTLRVFGWKTK